MVGSGSFLLPLFIAALLLLGLQVFALGLLAMQFSGLEGIQ